MLRQGKVMFLRSHLCASFLRKVQSLRTLLATAHVGHPLLAARTGQPVHWRCSAFTVGILAISTIVPRRDLQRLMYYTIIYCNRLFCSCAPISPRPTVQSRSNFLNVTARTSRAQISTGTRPLPQQCKISFLSTRGSTMWVFLERGSVPFSIQFLNLPCLL